MDGGLEALCASLTSSLEAAGEVVPKEIEFPTLNGISLFDLKNELFLSYVQNLVFLIILKIRSIRLGDGQVHGRDGLSQIHGEVVQKLAELRLYVDKGVKPLEGRLKYQIDKVVRAAEDAARVPKPKARTSHIHVNKQRRKQIEGLEDEGSVGGSDEEQSIDASEPDLDELALRPNAAGLIRSQAAQTATATAERDDDAHDGIYRPPRINPVSMPTTERKEPRERRPEKSATIEEFIADEYSTAPLAEPSIGSTITAGGRRNKSDRERNEDAERRTYEEANFVRLPKESRKERAKNAARFQGGFGGEEWRNLDAGLGRIERLTQKKAGVRGALARVQKRKLDSVDGPRGGGEQIGTSFQKRKRNIRRR